MDFARIMGLPRTAPGPAGAVDEAFLGAAEGRRASLQGPVSPSAVRAREGRRE
jgi:hypothetical protein